MNRQLCVFLDDALVGNLYENAGIWSFQYDESWLRHGYALSPGLPLFPARQDDGGTIRPVQWFFDNLLPEADARSQLMTYMANSVTVGTDAWSILSHFGAESAGALTLLPPNATLPAAGLLPLPDDAIEARIKAMPRRPLAANAPKKMSLAGAQQKLAIVYIDGQLFEPTGARASTHILKPDVLSEHYPCSAVNEWFCARLAQRMGLSVPKVELRFVPSPVYIIERFDRQITGEHARRLHALDALQLLTMAAQAKYAESGIAALLAVVAQCRTAATVRVALFKWTLFNVLIGNSDAHLKNISLLAGLGGYTLAPHDDLVSTAAWSRPELLGQGEAQFPDIAMSFPIEGIVHFRDLRRDHLQAFARKLGIGAAAFEREFNKMTVGIVAAADEIDSELNTREDTPPTYRASQAHMLRCIRFIPIATMVKQLQAN